MPRKHLTKKAQKTLDYIKEFWRENGYCPSYREIAAHFKLCGPSAAKSRIETLVRHGLIERISGRLKGQTGVLRLIAQKPGHCPLCDREDNLQVEHDFWKAEAMLLRRKLMALEIVEEQTDLSCAPSQDGPLAQTQEVAR